MPRTSDILLRLAHEGSGERVSLGEIVAALRGRAYALLVVVLGLPNCLPMVPPVPFVSGVLLGLVGIQLVVGRPSPWLPEWLLARSLARGDFEAYLARALPWLHRLERFARPRLAFFERRGAMRLVGLALVAFSLALLVAAPFVGQIPLGLAACLIGLGLVERDGVVLLGGVATGAVGVLLTLGFVLALVEGLDRLF